MKLVFTTIALIIMLFYTAGYYFVFHFEQKRIREGFAEEIRSGEITNRCITLFFLPAEFEALKINDKEFLLNGRAFDIIKQEAANGHIAVTCMEDDEESFLLGNLKNSFNGKSSASGGHNESEESLLSFLQMPFIKSCLETSSLLEYKYELSGHIIYKYQSPIESVINPPPEKTLS